ncbi:MAG: leucine-rich repeat domain-containing protein [Spirochaetaceae bacterium]|nr:leucine-rich repeat domain-containing protein [Spirochaetaceae bacterium]
MSSSVTTIGDEAFSGCTGLTSVTLSRRTHFVGNSFPSGAQLTYRD